MRPLTKQTLGGLLQDHKPPCVSIYQPTHRAKPDNLQDPIRYKNLVRDAERSLLERYSEREVQPLLEPLQTLADNQYFLMHQWDGLAVLAAAGTFEVFRLQRPVKELVVVADSFHIKPLLRMVQSADRYQVLGLDRQKATLYEGNRDALDEMDVGDMPMTITAALGELITKPQRRITYSTAPAVFYGKGGRSEEAADRDRDQFFRFIDREVLERFSRPDELPLVLAALPEHHTGFRRISGNPFLLPVGVEKDPSSFSLEQLRVEAWRAVEPMYLNRLSRLTEDYRVAVAHGLAAADLEGAAQAAAARRIATLLVEADRVIPGRFDSATGEVRADRLADPEVDDVLDDLAQAVLRAGGEVIIVPTDRMPTDTGLAATFRH